MRRAVVVGLLLLGIASAEERILGEPATRHGGAVLALSFSDDERTLTSLGADGFVRVREVVSGKELFSRRVPLGKRHELIGSSLYVDDGQVLRTIDLLTGQETLLELPERWSLGPDGRIAFVIENRAVAVVESDRVVESYAIHPDDVPSGESPVDVAVSSSAVYVAFPSTVLVGSQRSSPFAVQTFLLGSARWIESIAASTDGRWLRIKGRGTLWFDLTRDAELNYEVRRSSALAFKGTTIRGRIDHVGLEEREGFELAPRAVAVTFSQHYVAEGFSNGNVHVWHRSTHRSVRPLAHGDVPTFLAWMREGLVVAGPQGSTSVWNAPWQVESSSVRPIRVSDERIAWWEGSRFVAHASFRSMPSDPWWVSPHEELLVQGGEFLRFQPVGSDELTGWSTSVRDVTSVAFSGSLVAALGRDEVAIVSTRGVLLSRFATTGEVVGLSSTGLVATAPLVVIQDLSGEVRLTTADEVFAFSPEGDLATARGRHITIRDSRLEVVRELETSSDVTALAFTPHGLASGHLDETVRLWRTR